jgi:hypothetical protein
MDKDDLIFLAASMATTNAFPKAMPTEEKNKETVKKYFIVWHQLFSEIYREALQK